MDNECIECGATEADGADMELVDRAEPCSGECRWGCNHPTRDVYMCKDCVSGPADDSRAVRRAEQGYGE